MEIEKNLTDKAICLELGSRLERIRLDRNQTQAQLAESAGVSKRTVERLENGQPVQLTSFIRVCRELDLIERIDSLIPEPVPSPIDQIKMQGRTRRRASSPNLDDDSPAEWKWGEQT
ncbi:MAG: helix-turn-helix transcriptional regulator [Pirellulaceae bacterium]|jgi:transcriptional regulator with XRE-family HTH domain|nr:helix-turn-helix transcriptional regulator [Pirellulaceae bacterium]